jgi:Zn-dependent peptidase ImmA (M78 family)
MTPSALTAVEGSDLIGRLRTLAPVRRMSWSEAHSVAERQAGLLLQLFSIDEPPVPQFVIASLPGIVVDWKTDWPTSGMALRTRSHWRIVICASEPRWRQRFSLAHEFKHVLDDHIADRMFSHLAADQRQDRAERLCNYFAACVLMPRPWIKHDWCDGLQSVAQLARRYYVSIEAMTTRLSELGLTHMTLAMDHASGRHKEGAYD